MKIGIIAKPHRADFSSRLSEILEWLEDHDCEPVVEDSVAEGFDLESVQIARREDIPRLVQAIIVFGGDGTLLSVARSVGDSGTPILGVNLGSLGFLTEVTVDELYPAVEQILAGQHRIERRWLLKTEIVPVQGIAATYHALNDVVINKGAISRIISLETYIQDDFTATFLADGIIVATPTGSTAYSLSAGGPIVFPTLDSVILTPICPHTLTNRPLVVPADAKIRIVLSSGKDVMLTVDGQVGTALQEGDAIWFTRSPFSIGLIQSKERSYFDILREKLKWAER